MNRLIIWLIAEGKRADADYEMSSDTDDASYHQGEVDAYRNALEMLNKFTNGVI